MKKLVLLLCLLISPMAGVGAQTLIRGTLIGHSGPFTDEVGHNYTKFRIIDLNGNAVGYYFREYENFMGWVGANYQAGDILAITGTIMQEPGGMAMFMIPRNINLNRNGAIVATIHSTPPASPFYSRGSHLSNWPTALLILVYCQYIPGGPAPLCPDYPAVTSIPFSQWCAGLEASPVSAPYTSAHGRLLDLSVGCP